MTARRNLGAILAGAALLSGLVAAWRSTAAPAGQGASVPAAAPPATALVARRDLVDSETVPGTLGHGAATPVIGQLSGTITALAAVGTVVGPGQVLYEVDGRGVLLFPGARPMYRRHDPSMSPGDDVRQMEQALIDLGHAKGTGLARANPEWSESTTTAVKRWERAVGRPEDGTIEPGEVVFLPMTVRVASRSAAVGSVAQPGSPVLQATATARSVTVALPAVKAVSVAAGDPVTVTLPDRTTVEGVVAAVGTKASKEGENVDAGSGPGDGGGQGGPAPSTVELFVTVADQARLGSLEEAPVDVRLTRDQVLGALAVPVSALLALAEGGYAVQVAGPVAARRLVAVETGLFAGTFVEVRSPDLQPGVAVVVPS